MSEEEVSQEGKTLVEVFAGEKKKAGRPAGSKNKPKVSRFSKENELLKRIAELEATLAKGRYNQVLHDATQEILKEPKPDSGTIWHGKPNSDAPPMPAMEPDMGDKTPAVVEWYRDYWPEEYARRYKDRKTHLVEKPRKPRDDDDLPDAREMKITHEKDLNTDPRFY